MGCFAFANNFVRNTLSVVRGNGVRDALITAAFRLDLRVDAHERPAGVHQRTARVTVVHWRIGLNHGNVYAVFFCFCSTVGVRYNTRSHGILQIMWRAKRHHGFTRNDLRGVAKGNGFKV